MTAKTGRSAAAEPTAGRLAGLTGLRAIAALSLVAAHTWSSAAPEGPLRLGWLQHVRDLLGLSVVLFFTLSGFLLYRRFAAAILGLEPRVDVGAYAKARAMRIIPTYWAILVVSGVVLSAGLVRNSSGELVLGNMLAHPWQLLANAALAQNLIPQTMITGLGPSWTLVVELWFYLAMPLVALPVVALARTRDRRARLVLAFVPPLVLLATGLSAKTAAEHVPALGSGDGYNPDWASVFQRSLVYHADLFAAGMTAAIIALLVAKGSMRLSPRVQRTAIVASAVLFLVIAWLDIHELYSDVLYEASMGGVFALLMTALVNGRRGLVAKVLDWRWLVLVGTASYSIFLSHDTVIRLLKRYDLTLSGVAGLPVNLALVLAITIPVSLLSYRLVEAPTIALGKRSWGRRRIPAPAGAVGDETPTSSV